MPIVCASCSPHRWREGDEEIAGRWNDEVVLEPLRGERLSQLLAFLELLLPFPHSSQLPQYRRTPNGSTEGSEEVGPATLIEAWSGGILRDIMILVLDASRRAIAEGLSHLPVRLLESTWRTIQSRAAGAPLAT